MSNCYFCDKNAGDYIAGSYWYHDCSTSNLVEHVISAHDAKGDITHAHIYYDKWHIRLHLRDNETVVIRAKNLGGQTFILRLPGFPLKPSNIKDKLKLYSVLMKCFYCPDQEITASRPEWKTRMFCDTCGTTYQFDGSLKNLKSHYYGKDYKNRTYVVIIRLQPDKTTFNLIDDESNSLIELNYVPSNITPHNFLDKLPTLLTFS